jgi:hypothetical protein
MGFEGTNVPGARPVGSTLHILLGGSLDGCPNATLVYNCPFMNVKENIDRPVGFAQTSRAVVLWRLRRHGTRLQHTPRPLRYLYPSAQRHS